MVLGMRAWRAGCLAAAVVGGCAQAEAPRAPEDRPHGVLREARSLYDEGRRLRGEAPDRPERYLEAIAAFQAAAAAIASPDDRQRYGVAVWKEIGECFFALERFVEAGLAFWRGAETNPEDPLAGECAYWAYRSFQERYKITQDPSDRERIREARARLHRLFPHVPHVNDIAFFEARDLETKRRFLEAARAFEQVRDDNQFHGFAMVKAGACYYREYLRLGDEAKAKGAIGPTSEYLESAESRLQEFLRRSEAEQPPDTEPDKVVQRKVLRGRATFFLGRVAETRQAWEKVLGILAGFADSQKPIDQIPTGAEGLFMELNALVHLERVEGAVAKLKELEAYMPQYKLLGVARQMVGKLLDAEADRLERVGRAKDSVARRRQGGWLLCQWLADDVKSQGWGNLLGVAARAKEVADGIRKETERAPPGEERAALAELEEAARFYAAASKFYRVLRAKMADFGLDGATQERVVRELGESLYAQAQILDQMGSRDSATQLWQEALPLLEEILQRHPKTIGVIRQLADAYTRLDRPDDALRRWGGVFPEHMDHPPAEWWESKLRQFERLLGAGRAAQVIELLANLELLHPDLGGAELAAGFRELKRRALEARR